MKTLKLKTLMFAAALVGSASAMAQTSTATLTNTTTIGSVCSISGTGFTNAYDPTTTNSATGADLHDSTSASVTYTCTNAGTAATINLDQGLHPATGSTDAVPLRQLSATVGGLSVFLSYFLFSDSGFTTVWGNTPATSVAAIQDGSPHQHFVFVSIPRGQNEPIGSYTDSVIATINF
jgi:spore coat protein U-like protein